MSRVFTLSTDVIEVAAATSINNLAALTYAAWIYPTSLPSLSFSMIATKAPATTGLIFGIDNGFVGSIAALFVLRGTTGANPASTSVNDVIALNTWQRVIATYDDAGDRQFHLYINGTEVSYVSQVAATGTLTDDSAGPLDIGQDSTFSLSYSGSIANFELWNVALTSVQVASDYAGTAVLPSNLVDSLTFLTDQGNPEPDASGNNNTGAITGTTYSSSNPPTPGPGVPVESWLSVSYCGASKY